MNNNLKPKYVPGSSSQSSRDFAWDLIRIKETWTKIVVWYGTFYSTQLFCGREKSDWVFVHKVVSISI